MKKAKQAGKAVKRKRCNKLSTIYDSDPEIRNKLDEVADLLYKIICKASTGCDSKQSISINQLCRGLNKFGFKITKNQLYNNILVLNIIRDSYKLELIHTRHNSNVTSTHYPPVTGSHELNSLDLNNIDKQLLKKLFLSVDLRLSVTNTIY